MGEARPNVLGDDPPLLWSEEFSVGVPQLDDDHRTLFELVETLAAAADPVPLELINGILDALAEYVVAHFTREEAHQAALGFPELAKHRELHQQLLARMEAFRARLATDPAGFDVPALRVFLRRWLVSHILHEDMRYRWYEEGDPLDD